MNPHGLIHYIFDTLEGDFTVFSKDTELGYPLTHIPDTFTEEEPVLSLVLRSDMCVGVVIPLAEKATFSIVNGDRAVHVAMFSQPIHIQDVPEDVEVEIPLLFGGWEYRDGTDIFYDADEVFGVRDDVTITDTGGLNGSDNEPEIDGDNEDRAGPAEEDPAVLLAEVGGEMGADGASGLDGVVGGGPANRDTEEPVAGAAPETPAGMDAGPDRVGQTGPADDEGVGVAAESGTERPGDQAGAVAVAQNGPAKFANDAELIGTTTPALDSFFDQQATLLFGEMWGARDNRNTQDGQWNAVALPWSQWILGGEKAAGRPAWGLSRHPVGKHKEGACIVLGSSIGKARKAKAMEYMYAVGLDVDSGAVLNDVLAKIEKLGLFCLVYTSFNHGKRGLTLKRDDVLRKLSLKSDPSLAEIKEFLSQHDKHRYEPGFIAEVKIKEARSQTKEGVVIVLDTPPLEKFRLIFPLAERVKLIDLAETHDAALTVWEDKITGLAVETLGVNFDTSCTDPSRLFYTGRHPADAEDWYCAVVQGRPLRFDDIPIYKKTAYNAKRDKMSAWEIAGGADGTENNRPQMALTPNGASLNEWHSRYKERFQFVELLEAYCPERIRHEASTPQGSVHTECPFESEHSSEGGTATMAWNALEAEKGYWTWFCHHDACQGRHKLQMLEEALRAGWFDEALLDKDAGFLLPPSDQELEEEEDDVPEENEAVADGGTVYVDPTPKSPEELAALFTTASTQTEIEKFIKKAFRQGVDDTVRANITANLAHKTNLGKRDIKKMWTELDAEQRKRDLDKDREDADEKGAATVNEWDFAELVEYGHKRIVEDNKKVARVFHYMENLCRVRETSDGHAKMKFLDRDGFAHHLNTVAKYVKVSGEKAVSTGVSAPDDVVRHLFASDYGTYPELRGLVTTPAFTRRGSLLTVPGYDRESRLFYKPSLSLSVPTVKATPTPEDVRKAKELLIGEILADFPLGALSRSEIVDQALEGAGVAAVANMIALILLPFMREMIDGPTPGHLLVKPAPGTGASLLTDVFSIITTGRVTPALAMPTNKDEMSKTLTSVLSNGQNIVFFDNINHSVDSGELASAMSAPTYQARILGKSQTIEVDVRCAWVFTGNNVSLSSELIRRLVMIDLDARLENPELRVGFRHADIRGWAAENRGELVWACLTLIQNWIAKGQPKQNDEVLASFENWSRIMGGILKEAGIGGFMANRDELREKSDDSSDDELLQLLDGWWSTHGSAPIHLKGSEKAGSKVKGLLGVIYDGDISLPLRQTRSQDGDMTYSPKALATYLSRYKDRVFTLENDNGVTITKHGQRTKNGHLWQLVSNRKQPVSNVPA